MIVFDLRCDGGHVFESWFGSSADYAGQKAGGLVRCPLCDSDAVEKAVMAPNVAAKGNQRAVAKPEPPEKMKAALAVLAKAQAEGARRLRMGGHRLRRSRAGDASG